MDLVVAIEINIIRRWQHKCIKRYDRPIIKHHNCDQASDRPNAPGQLVLALLTLCTDKLQDKSLQTGKHRRGQCLFYHTGYYGAGL